MRVSLKLRTNRDRRMSNDAVQRRAWAANMRFTWWYLPSTSVTSACRGPTRRSCAGAQGVPSSTMRPSVKATSASAGSSASSSTS